MDKSKIKGHQTRALRNLEKPTAPNKGGFSVTIRAIKRDILLDIKWSLKHKIWQYLHKRVNKLAHKFVPTDNKDDPKNKHWLWRLNNWVAGHYTPWFVEQIAKRHNRKHDKIKLGEYTWYKQGHEPKHDYDEDGWCKNKDCDWNGLASIGPPPCPFVMPHRIKPTTLHELEAAYNDQFRSNPNKPHLREINSVDEVVKEYSQLHEGAKKAAKPKK